MERNLDIYSSIATAWYPGSNWEQRWLSSFSGYGKQSDDDWYKIDVSDSEKRLNIDLRFTHSQGDIDLALFNSSEVQLAVSNGSADNEYIDYTVAAGGTYYLVVYYGNAGNTYDLWWDDIGLPVPAAPTLVSPVNGSAFSSGTSMNLDWNASSGATDYYAHLTGPGVDRNSGWTTNTNWVAGVLAAGTYQWNVKARNANGESAVSATWSFTINQVVDCNSFSYNGIILFADPTCRGTEVRFPAATQITNLSGYSFDNLSSSIYVGSGWSVRVYEQANGAGLTRCITGSMWNLGVDTYDGSSTYINNTVSSVQVFNNTSCAVPLVNNAQFISQSVPTAMVVGQTYTVSVTMKNTGNKPWTQVGNYKLGSQNPSDSSTWGMHRVFLNTGEVVNPGAQKVFTFNVTAPTTPGTYNFQWRMLQEYVEWFGGTSTNVAVIVSDGSLPVNSTWYQESDSKMYYTSGWTLRTNVSASGGKYMQTSTQGAYVEFKTMGNAFTLKRIMSSARGTMNVCIDGVCQTINNYSATTKFQQQLVFKNLAGNAPHTIRVVNNQAKPMDLDAVLVWSYVMYPLTPSTTWYQENNANFVYIRVADWVTKSSTSASGGKYIQSSVQGAYVDFKVQSNAFTLKRKMSPSSGTMNVCIDGVCQTIDNYSATTKWQQQLVFKNLTGTLPHTIRITNNQAKVIDIDSILSWSFVMNPLVPSLTWYQENNVNLLYTRTADWTSVSSTSASSGKYIQTNVQSAYVELKVQNSSSFIIMRKMDSSRGTINVCIDGVCQSVSNYSPTVKWKQQQTFYLSGTGVHTIRIVNNEYKVMDIDAIKVL
ncbi:MAG: YD repeat protein [candidate division WS6 bacterium GW2011_GWA2_37_6]|uniref:YD repeat protein n=1 Tax=candidate division WS6 bacterium GW2011_GWA2_37_6 TaxID=1619087 RepID=A0A0G0H8G6_9BACT|nr:MAG: YD repeat protein [candidate division WS6 bacterium GW2011_GWA2_37_6]